MIVFVPQNNNSYITILITKHLQTQFARVKQCLENIREKDAYLE